MKQQKSDLEIQCQIQNVVNLETISHATVKYTIYDGSTVKISIAVECSFDPSSDSIPGLKDRAREFARASCEKVTQELAEKKYL